MVFSVVEPFFIDNPPTEYTGCCSLSVLLFEPHLGMSSLLRIASSHNMSQHSMALASAFILGSKSAFGV